jgi:hypothetical protein
MTENPGKTECIIDRTGEITSRLRAARDVPKDCCNHLTCIRPSEFWWVINVHGTPLHVELCLEHDREFRDRLPKGVYYSERNVVAR